MADGVEMLAVVGLTGVLLIAGPVAPGPAAPAAATAPTPAEALARRVEARTRHVTDLTAHFVQTYRSGAIGRQVVEKGVVSLKPPGRMRWDYRDPEPKTFVSDGKTSYFYVPADKQVIRRETADARDLPSMLLSGQSDILSTFDAALEVGAPGLQRLRLTPRKPDPEIEHLYVDVDASDRIRAILVVDVQGNRSQFAFDDIRENVGLQDKIFRFEVPRGVEVIAG